jgi:hypothetical membrane protein
VFAVLATVASGTGSILESLGVRRAGAFGGRTLDLVTLRRQYIYFLGVGVDLVGFVFAAAALHRLPLFLVQSALAFSVGVTATISFFMGTRLADAGWVWLGIGAAGLILLGVSAEPSPARALQSGWRWILLGMAATVAAIALPAPRRNRSWAAPVLAFGAGLGFCVVGISARTLNVPDPVWPRRFRRRRGHGIRPGGRRCDRHRALRVHRSPPEFRDNRRTRPCRDLTPVSSGRALRTGGTRCPASQAVVRPPVRSASGGRH